jgi:O-antigen/teichoic acid export membrane protein
VTHLARNIATRYFALIVEAALGIVVLPYTVHHLGAAAYGLWMLTTSVTQYFTTLQLGYGGAIVKFVAEFRARKDPQALNEVLSTMFYVYTGIGAFAYALAIVVAWLLPRFFHLDPAQAHTGQVVLLITAAQIALFFPFSVFGGVINGFERFYVNNVVGTASNVAAALAQVLVLWAAPAGADAGATLVRLVAATTLVRTLPFLIYRVNAYRAFPALRLRLSYFRRGRLRDLTGFSAYLAVIDWSSKLAYATDNVVVGRMLGTSAVGVFSVGSRLTEQMFKVTNQLHTLLFPAVVTRATTGDADSQQTLMVIATRFQLAMAVAVAAMSIADGDVLIRAFFGPDFSQSVAILQLLAFVVILRAWMAMPSTVLKGTGYQRYVAIASAIAAVANALLSVVLVQWMGLVGSAVGTVIPATVLAACCIFPQACRAVGLPTLRAYRHIVWPTLWPAAIAGAAVMATRQALPVHLYAVLPHMALGACLYLAIFVAFGIDRAERQWIVAAVNQLRARRQAASLAAA